MASKNTKTDEIAAEVETTENAKAEVKTKMPETIAANDDGREDITIPKGYAGDEPNLFVSVNGVNYLLPKGKTSRVPRHVAAEIRRSWRAQERMDERVDALLEATKAPTSVN